ncbi:MAG: ATP/GTP-binding protein, partial [Anaerovoracaceae bacterium]
LTCLAYILARLKFVCVNVALRTDYRHIGYRELMDNKLSVLKYIYRNTPTNFSPVITKMIKFCENMLWYRGLSDGNAYCGFTNGSGTLTERLYESGRIHDFEDFLQENGLQYKLKFESVNGIHELYAIYNKGQNKAPFVSLASTGTMALFLFYTWCITAFDQISLLFIDEFDAFLHYESAENLVLRLNQARNFQSVLTTHNTYLMQNRLTRPDCCYIMSGKRISNLYEATDKEIREAHNLEKMYINGAFTV